MTLIQPPSLLRPSDPPRSYDAAVRQIERHRGPAIITALDSVLFERTRVARAKRGEILLFDPFELSGADTHGWSPLTRSRTWTGAIETAWSLALAGQRDQRGIDGPDFWAVVAEQQLAPLLYAAAADNRQVEDLVGWVYGLRRSDVEQTLQRLSNDPALHHNAEHASRALEHLAAHPDRTRTAVEATAQALLRAFRFTRVARATQTADITAERLLSGANTVYLVSDGKAAKLLRPLMTCLLADITSDLSGSCGTLLLTEASDKIGTVDGTCAGDQLDRGQLRRIAIPDRHSTALPRAPRRRRIHLRNPITLS